MSPLQSKVTTTKRPQMKADPEERRSSGSRRGFKRGTNSEEMSRRRPNGNRVQKRETRKQRASEWSLQEEKDIFAKSLERKKSAQVPWKRQRRL